MISIQKGNQWKQLPYPTKYDVGLADLDSDSTRNELGGLIRNRIAQGKTKIKLAFIVQGAKSAEILDLVKPDAVQVKYLDPRVTTMREIKAYVSDRDCHLVVNTEGMQPKDVWWEVSFNLIEY